jgi:hypothetical protein
MSHTAAFVETPIYFVIAVLIVGVFWFTLHHDKVLLLPYVALAVLAIELFGNGGLLQVFLVVVIALLLGGLGILGNRNPPS